MHNSKSSKLIMAIATGNVRAMETKGGTAFRMITGAHVVDRDGYIRKVIHFDPKGGKATEEILQTPILSNHFKQQGYA